MFLWHYVLPCSSLICKVTQQHWRWEEFLRKPSLPWCHCLTPQLAPGNLYLGNTELGWERSNNEEIVKCCFWLSFCITPFVCWMWQFQSSMSHCWTHMSFFSPVFFCYHHFYDSTMILFIHQSSLSIGSQATSLSNERFWSKNSYPTCFNTV